jgi:hypothetical protein
VEIDDVVARLAYEWRPDGGYLYRLRSHLPFTDTGFSWVGDSVGLP